MDTIPQCILPYRFDKKKPAIDVLLSDGTVWLSKQQIEQLFQRNPSVIARHIRRIFSEGELRSTSNMQKLHLDANHIPVTLYSLNVVIAVGHSIHPLKSTQFRVWATKALNDHLIWGYTLRRELSGAELHQCRLVPLQLARM